MAVVCWEEVSVSDQWRWLDDLLKDVPEKPTVEEVAEVLSVSTRTVLNWLRDPENPMPGYKLPGKWLILREELRDWLRATRNSPNAANPDEEESPDDTR